MYDNNHLASRLRMGTIGHDEACFLKDPTDGHETSYGTFFENAERMAAVLAKLGLAPGDRVAVQASKTVAMLELYVGTVLAGGVFLPLNTAYTESELKYFLTDAKPKILVCQPEDQEALKKVAYSCNVEKVLTLAADESGSLTQARDNEPPGFKAVDRSSKDMAAILYTSGTTGRSKGAMLSHGALASNAETLKDYWHFSKDDVLIHALPIFHTHGLFVAMNVTLLAGSSCVFMPRFNVEKVLAAMPKATVLMGVPTFYSRLLEAEGLSNAARTMRLFVSGSAPLQAETHNRWKDVTGHSILERYGMTETNMNASNPYNGDRRAGTVGFPLPGIEMCITNPETGAELQKGEVGMVEVRGPNVFSGYWNMPEKTAEELRENGFFVTGDLGRFDEDGYLHIVGRGKDLIISGGFNIYPKEIELLIDGIPGVRESAVVGVPHPDLGEGVVAVVVTAANSDVNGDSIAQIISADLARFKLPKRIVLVKDLPRNAMGKVKKNELRAIYADLLNRVQ